jgi:hypothetical protein
LVELAGGRIFRMRTDFQPVVRHLNKGVLTAVPICAVDLFKCVYMFVYKARLNDI